MNVVTRRTLACDPLGVITIALEMSLYTYVCLLWHVPHHTGMVPYHLHTFRAIKLTAKDANSETNITQQSAHYG